MIRSFFLLLILFCPALFAQTGGQPEAVEFDEFTTATNTQVRTRMQSFYGELGRNAGSQGYTINYGTDSEISLRENQIREAMRILRFDAARMTLVRGGFWRTVKTEFWLAPTGAENPPPASNAEKIDEFGAITLGELEARIDRFLVDIYNQPGSRGGVLLYGSPREVARRERQIRNYIRFRRFDSSLIFYKNAGADAKEKIEFWIIKENKSNQTKTRLLIVPPGAKPPNQ